MNRNMFLKLCYKFLILNSVYILAKTYIRKKSENEVFDPTKQNQGLQEGINTMF